jgi:hypothetical protein
VRVLKVAAALVWSWLACPALSVSEKATYLLRLGLYALGVGRGRILYLGRTLVFDNPRTPFVLLRYPQDVAGDLLGHIEGPVQTVLDIGGNIGQFAVTLLHFRPQVERLDVFEPNPTIFPILEQNLSSRPQVRLHRLGVGRPGPRTLFAVSQASSTASFVQNRA